MILNHPKVTPKNFINFNNSQLSMGVKRKKKLDVEKNRRLDAFLTELEIETEKKEKIIKHVEELAFETFRRKSEPKLRLK